MQGCAPSSRGFDTNIQRGSSLGLASNAFDEGIPLWIGLEIGKDVPHLLLRGLNFYLGLQSLAQFRLPSLRDSEASSNDPRRLELDVLSSAKAVCGTLPLAPRSTRLGRPRLEEEPMHALLVTADVEPGREEEGLEYLRTMLPELERIPGGRGELSHSFVRERGICQGDGSNRLTERPAASGCHLPRRRGARDHRSDLTASHMPLGQHA